MTLCDICREIPWDALPEIPPNVANVLNGWWSHQEEFWYWPREYQGCLFYSSLEALQNSATESNCDLCSIILSQMLKWNGVANDTDGALSEFWLVRSPSKDGVWVMTSPNRTADKAILVAAIGLCAREGKNGINHLHLQMGTANVRR